MTSYCGAALRRVLGATAVAALLAVPNLASAQEETFGFAGALGVPGAALTSFDISWVDTSINLYFLADRNNKSIDVVPIDATPTVFQIIPRGSDAFAGTPGSAFPCLPGAGPNDCAGPNGVITYFNTHTGERELAVGDGPTKNPACIDSQPFCSTVKVFAGSDAHLVTIVNTGGAARADELCFDPVDHLILVANDADRPPFVTFISTDTGQIVNQIFFPNATNGIEQCNYRPADGKFYLNIPEVSGAGDDSSDGAVVVIDPTITVSGRPGVIVNTFPVDVTVCAGPQGQAIGPGNQILLGCNAPSSINGGTLNGPQNAAIIDATTGMITTVLNDLGGDDEVWFEPVSQQYFLAGGSHLPTQQLGIVDAGPPPEVDPQAIPQGTQLTQFPTSTGNPVNQQAIFVGFTGTTTRRSHSTAAWSGNISGSNATVAFLPVAANGGTPVPSSSVLCDPAFTHGCIAIFLSNFGAGPILN
jgi:hypothetical protein